MQVKNISVHELLGRLRLYFQENDLTRKYANEEPPLRAELFNTDQLAQHGKYLAKTHKIYTGKGKAKEKLLKRLAKNEKILIEVRNLLTDALKEDRQLTPAGEWLLDNFYLIEDQIRTGKRHLPKGYSEGLPYLINTSSASLPRAYDIALEIIAHSDGRIDLESLYSYINAYQSVTTLKIGELWAIPIMLRLALIENLRRVSARVAIDKINQSLADYWATLMTDTADKDPKSPILVIADMARSGPPMEGSFVAEMIRQLMWKGPNLALPLTWMEQRLTEVGQTSNELVNTENQKQAADQVSISNSIGSLRFLGSIEWREFVERTSAVEHTLQQDASGIYSSMDFATRDRYRHIIEKIAKNSALTENEIAEIAVQLSQDANSKPDVEKRQKHVGYYLADEGLPQTEKLAKQRLPFKEIIEKGIKNMPFTFYVGGITLITLAVGSFLLFQAYEEGVSMWVLILTAIASYLGVSHMASILVNWLTTLMIGPELLPRLDFAKGIPEEHKSMVIIPTMLLNPTQVEGLLESLEVRFLANRDKHLHFGILTDFADARTETMPVDAAVLELAKIKIEELNQKYAHTEDKFFLFHRPRKWNPYDKIWMGYERKRGKLGELNAILRGADPAQYFSLIVGDMAALKDTKYIVTLDTDTQLPRDAGWKLVGTMAHPLNRPVYDEAKQRVTKGYGILQPRVSVSLSRSGNSVYAKMHGNEPGIDPYTRLTSDVYQDLFQEGSFIGKGIYDIDAFEHTLNNRFPENRILSHDLLEGCYTRSGLISDVQLYEEYPTHYSSDVNRRHRWIRGDWQIGYWSLPMAPDASKHLKKNPLSAISRWKIFDNLRRSLVPVALTGLMLLGWTVLHSSWMWTTAVLIIIMLPSLISSLWGLFHKSKEITFWQHIVLTVSGIADGFFQNVFLFTTLPYESYYSLDAILRTTWRMLVSHKKLLEWNPSHTEQTSDKTLMKAYRSMWFGPFLAALSLAYIIICDPIRLVVAAPVLILWAVSPFAAWWVSKPLRKYEAQLTGEQIIYLKKIARKTWAFFEKFVGQEDNWLPIDNYQQKPNNVIAHRTSPTNIGLALLSNLSAYDFGYTTMGVLLQNTANTIGSLDKMERYRGHFYNWYDTTNLQPLHPRYVSTVDSGNFAGHILTLKQGLLTLPAERIISPRLFTGLLDTLYILLAELPGQIILQDIQTHIGTTASNQNITPQEALKSITHLQKHCAELLAKIEQQPDSEAFWWAQALAKQCNSIHEQITNLYPWVSLDNNVPPAFTTLYNSMAVQTPDHLARLELSLNEQLKEINVIEADKQWLTTFKEQVRLAASRANEMIDAVEHLALKCDEFADIEYEFLYDRSKHLLTIGYNVDEHQRDNGFYDLMASESRLCSFVAVAQGKLPQETWFALGRLLANTSGDPVLLSWSGSMFEYLMPLLVMPGYENTLIDQTHKAAVARQIEYGADREVPWGISESCYNMMDANLNYQYHAFGVPGLGLKRGLAEDLVIAPYASALALMVAPEEACLNMERLSSDGYEGRYGLYEAIDYTPSRVPRGQSSAIIQSFMAHHQGMSLLSIAYALQDQPMQKRFEAELQFQATLLLLQERIPKTTTYYSHSTDIGAVVVQASNTEMRVINTPHTPIPEIQMLSNGRYHVMVTNAGGGYSKWKDIGVTRWREDSTCDNWGTFCYIRDLEDGAYWSNAHQPVLTPTKNYEATFTQGRAEFRRKDNNIETHTEIVVSPEDDIEMRRVHLTNRSRRPKTVDVTSYAEVILNAAAADAAHPAFNNLFIETEIIEGKHAILCSRRSRAEGENPPSMFHLVSVNGADVEQVSYETDRMKFIGRGNTVATPAALSNSGALSNTSGAVLDPIVAIRYQVTLQPEETVIIDMITGIGENQDICRGLIDKYQDKHHKDRVFELAWTHSQVMLRQINATEADAQMYGRLASSIIFANPALRADPSVIIKNNRGQSGLWGYSISGDLPIVLLEIEEQSNIELAKQLVQAHAYWRLKGLAVDLVIWNEDHGGYRQVLQNQILGLIAAGTGAELTDHPGGIFVRAADQISNEDRILFQTVARMVISDKRGTLEDHINRKPTIKNVIPVFAPIHQFTIPENLNIEVSMPDDLNFYNGSGGFSADGKEYVIMTEAGKYTPAPWVNVLANPNFGTVVSESGQAYTWITNAHEFRLTPWENDAVSDKSGEAFYIRDEETGNFWSPTPLPAVGKTPYITRHGFGYSVFEHSEDGIASEMKMFTDIEAPVKFITIKIKNTSGRQRKVSVTGFMEWILGDLKPKNAMHIVTELETTHGALLAKNPYNTEFTGVFTFFDTDDQARTYTGDRTEFIGRNGTLKDPEAMQRTKLSGKLGAGLDPCAAIQSVLVLEEEQEREIVFRLGAGKDLNETIDIIRKFKGVGIAKEALEKVQQYWQHTLGALQIETPDAALNTLANGWLMYQTIACRLWARSGYYQSGGAFGFRDQLQDVLAIIQTRPELARQQILLSASRQFLEGDVQHWWHPPLGRGVRTRCSDDLLWLPFVTSGYVVKTGDTAILKETATFLEGRQLNPGEESYYDLPATSNTTATLYEHCVRSIQCGLKFGERGLPLFGSGDWNDGMDMVGKEGKGESIWLAFFLYDVLVKFTTIAADFGDQAFADKCKQEATQLQANIEKNGWDGEWYRRGYFDDGTPLGSSTDEECQIDSISQSWAILSGAGDTQRTITALDHADKRLVHKDKHLIQLLDPPFDKSKMNPGYIKGYVPGIRENGGQYTHAAVWMVMAHAKMGNNERAWELMQLINPINHARDAEAVSIYKTEPYVSVADVYSIAQNTSRGGWTWYTGSAGWMYQLITTWILGLKQEGNMLGFVPCIPAEWKTCKISYRHNETMHHITISQNENASGDVHVTVDGMKQEFATTTLFNDGAEHTIEVSVPRATKQ